MTVCLCRGGLRQLCIRPPPPSGHFEKRTKVNNDKCQKTTKHPAKVRSATITKMQEVQKHTSKCLK